MIRQFQSCAQSDPQGLRQVRLFRINAGQHIDVQIVDLQDQIVPQSISAAVHTACLPSVDLLLFICARDAKPRACVADALGTMPSPALPHLTALPNTTHRPSHTTLPPGSSAPPHKLAEAQTRTAMLTTVTSTFSTPNVSHPLPPPPQP